MFRFLQKGSYMSRNRGLLIYLEALIHRGKACIKAARQRSSNIVSYEKYYLPSLFEGRLGWVLSRNGT